MPPAPQQPRSGSPRPRSRNHGSAIYRSRERQQRPGSSFSARQLLGLAVVVLFIAIAVLSNLASEDPPPPEQTSIPLHVPRTVDIHGSPGLWLAPGYSDGWRFHHIDAAFEGVGR